MADYKNEWTEQLRDLTDRIANREKFTFDVNGEALMKQYGDQYKRQGQAAMMDTMGKAQAMTGGYGNSYAQSVGQQTYQNYMQGATDKIPELYQLALNKYKAEGDEMKDLYGILTDREAFRQQEIEAQKAEDARAAARGSGGNSIPGANPINVPTGMDAMHQLAAAGNPQSAEQVAMNLIEQGLDENTVWSWYGRYYDDETHNKESREQTGSGGAKKNINRITY